MENEISFGALVRERRTSLGLTQMELARRAGCAAITVRKIEADSLRPSVQMAERLALSLNIPDTEQIGFVRMARSQSKPAPIPTPTPAPDEIGQADLSGRAVRGFELGEKIGSGGFGVVYRARQPSVDRDVAVKIIVPHYANHPDFIRRFEAEAQLIARLEHPFIVPLYDYWREPNAAFLIMRLLRGGSLRALLEVGAIPTRLLVRYISQVGDALHVAHRNGVVHRDIKPSNVLLDEEGNAYLADFGIARELETNGHRGATMRDLPLASSSYTSPEQLLGEPVRPQSDIYGLGLMLFEMLTGHRASTRPSIAYPERHRSHLPSLQSYNPALPLELDAVIQRATAPEPESRYADIPAFLTAFLQALAALDGPTPASGELAFVSPDVRTLAQVENPYRGLRAFTEADADQFFGREALIQELFGYLSDGSDLERFLAIVGPSGSGKSSVARAGLIPALRRGALPGSEDWFLVTLTPGPNPWEELDAALLRVAVNPPATLLAQLQEGERGLLRAVNRALPSDTATELVLVIDQFEEVFTLVEDEAVREQFLDSLVTAVLEPRSRLRLVITLRADFYHRPLYYTDFGDLLRQRTVSVLPLTPEELEEAISRPVARIGVRLEPGLAAAIVGDAEGEPGTLPLVQYALTELFERRAGAVLTRAAYEAIGGVLGALGRRAEKIYAELDPPGQEATRQLFLRLVTLGEGDEDTRRRVLRSEVEAIEGVGTDRLAVIIERFGRHRLLTFDHDPATREPTVEVAHEALLREWPRLRAWLSASRDDVRNQRLLASSAREWRAADRDDGYLLRGTRLTHFDAWALETTVTLTDTERAFLQASLAAREAREQAEEARRRNELETAQRLAETERRRAEEQTRAAATLRRRAQYLAAVAGLAAILALTAGFLGRQAARNEAIAEESAAAAIAESEARATAEADAIAQRDGARAQTALATSRELALAARDNLDTDPELSMLLALEALDIVHTREAEEALHHALQRTRMIMSLDDHSAEVQGVAYSPDGSRVATVSMDGTVKLWETESGQLLQTLPYEGVEFVGNTLRFDDSGERVALLAVGEGMRSVSLHVWDLRNGDARIDPTLPISAGFFTFDLSPDWAWLAVGREDGSAELWNLKSGEKALALAGEGAAVRGVAFDGDGSHLLTTNTVGLVRLWDVAAAVAAGTEAQPALTFSAQSTQGVGRAFLTADGSTLAIMASPDVEIWDLADTRQPRLVLRGHENVVIFAAFSPDLTRLATASADETARLWDLSTGEELARLTGHDDIVFRLAFSPDGHTVATASSDGTARIWNASTYLGGELHTFAHPETVHAVDLKLSPDEHSYALGAIPGPGTIRNAGTGEIQLMLGGASGTTVQRAAYNPDGTYLATVGRDGFGRIWDTATGALVHRFVAFRGGNAGGNSGTMDVTYSPDGSRLAAAGATGRASVWDTQTWEKLVDLEGHTAGLFSLAYSPDGATIATTSDHPDGSVRLWDAESGELRHVLGPNPGRAWGLAISPDGRLVAAGGVGGFLKIWDIATGDELGPLAGQTTEIGGLLFTPDGRHLVASGGGGITIWDLESFTLALQLSPANSRRVALSRDGRRLYVLARHDPVVRVYAMSLEETITLAQARLTRSLTEAECRQYLHVDRCPTDP